MKMIIALALALTSVNAFAAGGFSCTADDDTVKIEVGGVTTHGMGSPIVSSDGLLEYKPTDGQPKLANFTFKKANVSQYWNSGENFNLVLYTEDYTGKNSYETTVIIETVSKGDDENFAGTYKTSTYQSIGGKYFSHIGSGLITCSVE